MVGYRNVSMPTGWSCADPGFWIELIRRGSRWIAMIMFISLIRIMAVSEVYLGWNLCRLCNQYTGILRSGCGYSGNIYGTCPWCDFTVVKYDSNGNVGRDRIWAYRVFPTSPMDTTISTQGEHRCRSDNILITEEYGATGWSNLTPRVTFYGLLA